MSYRYNCEHMTQEHDASENTPTASFYGGIQYWKPLITRFARSTDNFLTFQPLYFINDQKV